ncbi:MAG TPA: hypothetical protein PLY29_06780 [Bacteroidales bacterium]|nr:hypothetical protein [Bacteroidales bacterium]
MPPPVEETLITNTLNTKKRNVLHIELRYQAVKTEKMPGKTARYQYLISDCIIQCLIFLNCEKFQGL